MDRVKLISMNVRGIGDPKKRRRIHISQKQKKQIYIYYKKHTAIKKLKKYLKQNGVGKLNIVMGLQILKVFAYLCLETLKEKLKMLKLI